jgi:hypothetical protein
MKRVGKRSLDLNATIRGLHDEKRKLECAIAALEELDRKPGRILAAFPAERRGRKSMGAAERQEVSARMKKYWAGRRRMKQTA